MAVELHAPDRPGQEALAQLRAARSQARTERGDWFNITAQGDTTDVYIYDYIDPWGVTAADFVDKLQAIGTPSITVHINSPGGDVFDAVAIYTMLRQHPANVTTSVEGLAASAASYIAQAGDTRLIAPNAMVMIHDAIGIAYGNAAVHTEMAGLLDKVSDDIASIYAARSGEGDTASWRAAMVDETWYSAEEAVDAGLADRVTADSDDDESDEEQSMEDRMAATFDLTAYRYAGREDAPPPDSGTGNDMDATESVGTVRNDDGWELDARALSQAIQEAILT